MASGRLLSRDYSHSVTVAYSHSTTVIRLQSFGSSISACRLSSPSAILSALNAISLGKRSDHPNQAFYRHLPCDKLYECVFDLRVVFIYKFSIQTSNTFAVRILFALSDALVSQLSPKTIPSLQISSTAKSQLIKP